MIEVFENHVLYNLIIILYKAWFFSNLELIMFDIDASLMSKNHQLEFLWSGHPPTYDPYLPFLQFNVKYQDVCVGC